MINSGVLELIMESLTSCGLTWSFQPNKVFIFKLCRRQVGKKKGYNANNFGLLPVQEIIYKM